jgi:hypothetical protein
MSSALYCIEGVRAGEVYEQNNFTVSGIKDGSVVSSNLAAKQLKNGMDYAIGSDSYNDAADKAEKTDYPFPTWEPLSGPTRAYDCAGLVADLTWHIGKYSIGAQNLYESVIVKFCRKLGNSEAYQKGDIVVFTGSSAGGQPEARHVALVINKTPVADRTALVIVTKDGSEGTFVNNAPLAGPTAIRLQNQLLFRRYGSLDNAEIWRMDSVVLKTMRFDKPGALRVSVAEENTNIPLSEVFVKVTFPGKQDVLRSGMTKDGEILFDSVPGMTGDRDVIVVKEGYQSVTKQVNLPFEQAARVNFVISKTKPAPMVLKMSNTEAAAAVKAILIDTVKKFNLPHPEYQIQNIQTEKELEGDWQVVSSNFLDIFPPGYKSANYEINMQEASRVVNYGISILISPIYATYPIQKYQPYIDLPRAGNFVAWSPTYEINAKASQNADNMITAQSRSCYLTIHRSRAFRSYSLASSSADALAELPKGQAKVQEMFIYVAQRLSEIIP